jgi:protein tyrosine/serine phosphatase
MKVINDKTIDYITYYMYGTENEKNENEEEDEELLNVEIYENEKRTTRILPELSYYQQYSWFFDDPTYIINNIYIGSAYNAANYNKLKELNIKYIINVTNEITNYYPDEFEYLQIKLYDDNKKSILKYLKKAYEFMNEKKDGNILVHCFMGASRSASVVIYYLMNTLRYDNDENYSFDDCLKYLKEKRLVVNPTFRLSKDLAKSIRYN